MLLLAAGCEVVGRVTVRVKDSRGGGKRQVGRRRVGIVGSGKAVCIGRKKDSRLCRSSNK